MTSFSDNFDRASIGSDWSIQQGSWDILSNQLRNTTGSGIIAPVTQPATRDQFVEVDLISVPGTSKVLLLRARADSSGATYLAMRVSNSNLSFRANSGSGEVTLTSTSITRVTPSNFRFEVSGEGSSVELRGYVDDVLTLSFTTDGSITGDDVAIQFTGTGVEPLLDNFAVGDLGATGTAPTVTTTSIDSLTVGTAFSQTIGATGTTPIAWDVSAGTLPAGITLNASTGVLSGTPTTAGAYSFTLRATNSIGNDTQAYSGTVAADDPEPSGEVVLTIGEIASTTVTLGTLPVSFEVDGVVVWSSED